MIELEDASIASRVADWVELKLAAETTPLSKTELTRIVSDATGDDPAESFINDVWRSLRWRKEQYVSSPFLFEGENVVMPNLEVQASAGYEMCLILSMRGVVARNGEEKLFERLVCEALKNYAGTATVFGWPFDGKGDANGETILASKVRDLAETMNEKFVESPGRKYKDRGLDVVAWSPFSEGRSGQFVLLVQCAAGHYWKRKKPVSIDAWKEYIHWASPPVCAFAVPCIVPECDWHNIHKDLGLLLDRIRIYNLLQGKPADQELSLTTNKWVAQQLDTLKVA